MPTRTTTEATPRPWEVLTGAFGKTQVFPVAAGPARCLNEADARLIVRAVNAHESLLAACKVGLARIESDIESTNNKTSDGDQLRAAISLAEGHTDAAK